MGLLKSIKGIFHPFMKEISHLNAIFANTVVHKRHFASVHEEKKPHST